MWRPSKHALRPQSLRRLLTLSLMSGRWREVCSVLGMSMRSIMQQREWCKEDLPHLWPANVFAETTCNAISCEPYVRATSLETLVLCPMQRQ